MRMPIAMRGAVVGSATAASLVIFAACSQSPKPVGQGGECALTSDCDRGLFCVPQKAGGRICTGDVTSIMNPTKPPPSGDAGRDAGDGGDAGDAGDSGTVPNDASSDAPTPPVDTGAPPVDAASD